MRTALLTFALATAAALLLPRFAIAAKIYIDVTAASERTFPIALVPPARDSGDTAKPDPGERFAELVQRDLELLSVFRFIDRKSFLEDPGKKAYREGDVDFASWAVLDALAVVKGWYRLSGSKLTVEAHLFDVLLKKELVAKKYEGRPEDLPSIAHRFANAVVQTLTGEPGLFETQIAFIGQTGKNKELFVMDFNGANQRQLTRHNSIVLSPNWSRDGKSLYYTAITAKGAQLYRYDFRAERSSVVTNFPGMVIGLRLDPTSDLLATTLTKDGNSELYLLTPAGKEHTRLTRNTDIDVSPSFSPDGKDLAFVSNRDGSAQIYRMGRTGDGTRRLTFKGNNNTSPAWSPRGDRLIFAGMDNDGQFDVFSMTADGGDMVRLTYDTRNNEDPAWAPDGQMIVFASNRTGPYQLYIMRPDGTHQVRISRDPFRHSMPAWGPKPK